MMKKIWSAIVITCSDQESANAFRKEIDLRQKKKLIHPETLILCVVDPKPNIGSGGATLNGILHITEHISALEGYTVISSDVLADKRILILHMGTSTPYSACSPGFLPLPAFIENVGTVGAQYSSLATQFDVLLQITINFVAEDSPSGFWVCSCDRLITIPPTKINWDSPAAVFLFGVPVEISFAANQHGVLKIGKNDIVEDIIYKGSAENIKSCSLEDGNVLAVSGLVFFKTVVAETLLNISVIPPLDRCTYLGLDAGARPMQNKPLASDIEDIYRDETDVVLSLFFDVLLCMSSNINEEDYVHGERSGVYGTVHFPDLDNVDIRLRKKVRQVLWDALNGILMKAEVLHDSEFHYISHDPSRVHQLLLNCPYKDGFETSVASIKFRKRASSLTINEDAVNEKNVVVVNTMISNATIGDNCVILHSCIKGNIDIGNNSMLINIQSTDLELLPTNMSVPDDVVFEALYLKLQSETSVSYSRILLMFGINDKLQKTFSMADSTVFNQSWETFFNRTGISHAELWSPDVPVSKRCLLNARLFPIYHPKDKVNILHLLWMQGSYKQQNMAYFWRSSWRLSLLEILDLCNPSEEFAWRTKLFFDIGHQQVQKSLLERTDRCFISFFQASIMDGYFEDLLNVLDNIIISSKDPAVISRGFACIADVLGAKASGLGGLRSGPAANYAWKKGLDMLQNGRIKDAVFYMATERKQWLVSPDLLVRAARHYEGAFQIQVRKAVTTARQFIKLIKKEPVKMNTWVTAQAPGRLDLSGGWSDTPPLCYELGGLVVSFALSIDNQKPIGCRVKRIPDYKIILVLGKENPIVLHCQEFGDLMSYSQPNSPGALLKAAFFCSELISMKTPANSLAEYLSTKHGSGFLLQTWSNLPHGSGLGTSSILAGTVLSALWTVVGMEHDVSSVLHAVLDLEQMLTTGGGWQDQVGGLCPGIKVGSSKNKLPLHVETRSIKTPDGFLEELQKHLLVIFTGKTRLARNMLQDVLRNWNARFPEIVQTASQLIRNAEDSIVALENGDLKQIGQCLNECWRHKKSMAHGCEPNVCKAIMEQIRPFVHGQCLAGAGGGGFMYVITKEEHAHEKIKEEIGKVKLATKATVHYAHIDPDGLIVNVDENANDETF